MHSGTARCTHGTWQMARDTWNTEDHLSLMKSAPDCALVSPSFYLHLPVGGHSSLLVKVSMTTSRPTRHHLHPYPHRLKVMVVIATPRTLEVCIEGGHHHHHHMNMGSRLILTSANTRLWVPTANMPHHKMHETRIRRRSLRLPFLLLAARGLRGRGRLAPLGLRDRLL